MASNGSGGSSGGSRGGSSSGGPGGADRRVRPTAVVRRVRRRTASYGGGHPTADGIGLWTAPDCGRPANPTADGNQRRKADGNRRWTASYGGRRHGVGKQRLTGGRPGRLRRTTARRRTKWRRTGPSRVTGYRDVIAHLRRNERGTGTGHSAKTWRRTGPSRVAGNREVITCLRRDERSTGAGC